MSRAMMRDTREGYTMPNHNDELKEQARQEMQQAIEKYASLMSYDDEELTRENAKFHLQYEVDDFLFTNFK